MMNAQKAMKLNMNTVHPAQGIYRFVNSAGG